MEAISDEMIFVADGFLLVNPEAGFRRRANEFVASRAWLTQSIFYGDQTESKNAQDSQMWSATFALGLDHVCACNGIWFDDVSEIIHFLKREMRAEKGEFALEFRLSSRSWYSEALGFVSNEDSPDLQSVRIMLERLIQGRLNRKA
jgi:hypothetical protein